MLQVNVKKHLGNDPKTGFLLDISFSVDGGITVLAGASGAGKTTTLRLIAGILTPDDGSIKLGRDTYFDSDKKIDLSIQKRRVGFVFQDYALFPHLNAEQNIAYGIKKNDRATKLDKAVEMLALFHIEHISKRIPREMSGGEQQRVALARVLASDPAIVLLDEPLSAVDVETRAKLLDEIETAQSQTGIPFIYVTHNETEADRLGKQRIILRDGRISA
jgi:ABC-type spermidine/putrescine transport systems, ATPase components